MNLKPVGAIVLSVILEVVKTVAIVFALAFIIRYLLIQPFIVDGNSMEPNFHNREFILVNKISYRFQEPKLGDVVVFANPQDPSVYFIKRIIGVPGDKVEIKNNKVYINNSSISESYLPAEIHTYIENNPTKTLSLNLAKDQFFVLGDNREQSSDSREWGVLKKSYIVGKLWVVLFHSASTYYPQYSPGT